LPLDLDDALFPDLLFRRPVFQHNLDPVYGRFEHLTTSSHGDDRLRDLSPLSRKVAKLLRVSTLLSQHAAGLEFYHHALFFIPPLSFGEALATEKCGPRSPTFLMANTQAAVYCPSSRLSWRSGLTQ